MVKEETKKDAELLRFMGKSYGYISNELKVSKSTLSFWFAATTHYNGTSQKQIEHLKRVRILAKAAVQKRCNERDKKIKEKINKDIKEGNYFEIFTKKIALSMLYWAEGTKHKKVSGLYFTNTDPMLIKTYISLLKQVFKIDTSKIRVKIYIHRYHDQKECELFWANIIGVDISQFNKTYIKPRNESRKFRENFRGICFVYYPNSDIRREILEIGRQFCEHPMLLSFNG